MIKSSQSPHFQRFCVPKNCWGKDGLMQPYGSPNPIQSRALVYCVAPQADCLSYVHHHNGRNRLNNPRARHLFSGSGQTAQTPISDSGSGQAGPASYHCLNFWPAAGRGIRAAAGQEQAWKPVLPGRLAEKARTHQLLLPGRRRQWSAALAPRSCWGENQPETYFERGSGVDFWERIDQEEDWRCCWCKIESLGKR